MFFHGFGSLGEGVDGDDVDDSDEA